LLRLRKGRSHLVDREKGWMQPGFGRRSTQRRLGFTRWWIRTSVKQIIACSLSYLWIYSGVSVCEVQALNIPHRTSLWTTHLALVDFKQAIKKEVRGESLPRKNGGTGFGQCAYSAAQAPVQRFRRFFQRFQTFQKLRGKVRSIRVSLIKLF
jgi:hypothetical protein